MGKLGTRCKIHRYQKLKDGLWHCSECTHYMPENVTEQVLGRLSKCWNCGEDFRLDEFTMDINQPICIQCKNPQLKKIEEYLRLQKLGKLPEDITAPIDTDSDKDFDPLA